MMQFKPKRDEISWTIFTGCGPLGRESFLLSRIKEGIGDFNYEKKNGPQIEGGGGTFK